MKNLSAEEFALKLQKLGACEEASEWASGKSLAEVWSTCHRADWMLWLVARYGKVDHKTIVSIACDCAEPSLAFVPEGENRPAECIATVRRWLKEEATIEEVWTARAADAARAAAAVWAADAAAAVWAAVWAAEWAAYAEDAWAAAEAARAAAEAARAAAEAAVWAAEAARAAAEAARAAAEAADSLKFSADICRKYIRVED